MDTIERLYEKRQIKLAKSILENAGYKIIKEDDSDREELERLLDLVADVRSRMQDFRSNFFRDLIDEKEFNKKGYEVEYEGRQPEFKIFSGSGNLGTNILEDVIDYFKSLGWSISNIDKKNLESKTFTVSKEGVAKLYFIVKYGDSMDGDYAQSPDFSHWYNEIYVKEYKELEDEKSSIEEEIKKIQGEVKQSSSSSKVLTPEELNKAVEIGKKISAGSWLATAKSLSSSFADEYSDEDFEGLDNIILSILGVANKSDVLYSDEYTWEEEGYSYLMSGLKLVAGVKEIKKQETDYGILGLWKVGKDLILTGNLDGYGILCIKK